MKNSIKNFLLVSIISSIVLLSACENTIHGMGKDLQNAGQELQNSSNK